jgi:hypothetical protein
MDLEKKKVVRLYSHAAAMIITTAMVTIGGFTGLFVPILFMFLLGNGISIHRKNPWTWISIPISCGIGIMFGMLYTSATGLF